MSSPAGIRRSSAGRLGRPGESAKVINNPESDSHFVYPDPSEWFYRFLQEPRRMFRRYFVDDLAFAGLVLREWRSRRRSPG